MYVFAVDGSRIGSTFGIHRREPGRAEPKVDVAMLLNNTDGYVQFCFFKRGLINA